MKERAHDMLHKINYFFMTTESNRTGLPQGFSQNFRIGCPKIHIWAELGVQILFIPSHYTQKYVY